MSDEISIKETHMNCSWEIKTFPQPFLSKEQTIELINQAYLEIKRIEQKYTEFKPSELNKINDAAGISPITVDEETWQLFNDAIKFGNKTNGIFNIAFASANETYADYKKIQLTPETREVFLPHKEMRISFGGIGKGYAVDRAYSFLKENGMVNFLINGSGDIRVHSHQSAKRPWRLGITNPFNTNNTIGMVNLTNQAMATSGTYLKKDHIKSKNNERPLSVTVICDDAITADIWGTYLMSLPYLEALNVLNHENFYGIIITADGKCLSSAKALQAQERFKENQYV